MQDLATYNIEHIQDVIKITHSQHGFLYLSYSYYCFQIQTLALMLNTGQMVAKVRSKVERALSPCCTTNRH